MRTVIRVIDTAAVITGTVIQDNHKKQGSRVLLDTQTRAQRVKDGGIAFGLKAERVQTLHSQTVGSRWDGGFKNKQRSKLKADQDSQSAKEGSQEEGEKAKKQLKGNIWIEKIWGHFPSLCSLLTDIKL